MLLKYEGRIFVAERHDFRGLHLSLVFIHKPGIGTGILLDEIYKFIWNVLLVSKIRNGLSDMLGQSVTTGPVLNPEDFAHWFIIC